MINPLSFAFLGDAVYELYIREYLIEKYPNVNSLHKETLRYVSAENQKRILDSLIEKNILTNEEINVIKTGRNQKSHRSKSTDIITYKNATGFEALIGYLYLNNIDRLNIIMKEIIGD